MATAHRHVAAIGHADVLLADCAYDSDRIGIEMASRCV